MNSDYECKRVRMNKMKHLTNERTNVQKKTRDGKESMN